MARINTALLVANATTVGSRVRQVQQDPAVQKSWNEAGRDLATAARSISNAAVETRDAWRRSDNSAGTFTRSYA